MKDLEEKSLQDNLYFEQQNGELKKQNASLTTEISELQATIDSEKVLSTQTLEVFKKNAADAEEKLQDEMAEIQRDKNKLRDEKYAIEE